MRPFRGIDTSLWGPLIDGTYAIVLTLLVIELPSLVMELVNEFNHDEIGFRPLATGIVRLITGYLGVFLILFDIWGKKRGILLIIEQYCNVSSYENLAMLLSMFLATLMPPLVYLVWQVQQSSNIQQLNNTAKNVESVEVITFNILFGICTLLIYGLVYLCNGHSYAQLRRKIIAERSDDHRKKLVDALARLKAIRHDSLARLVASPMVLLAWLSPDMLILAYGLSGLWHTDHQNLDRGGKVENG